MQINRHKKHNCLCKTDYYCFFASKKKTNKGKLHMEIGLVWRVNELQACKGKTII